MQSVSPTKQGTVYITDNGNLFCFLENPAISPDFPYAQGDEFNEVTSAQVEEIFVKHLGIEFIRQPSSSHPA